MVRDYTDHETEQQYKPKPVVMDAAILAQL